MSDQHNAIVNWRRWRNRRRQGGRWAASAAGLAAAAQAFGGRGRTPLQILMDEHNAERQFQQDLDAHVTKWHKADGKTIEAPPTTTSNFNNTFGEASGGGGPPPAPPPSQTNFSVPIPRHIPSSKMSDACTREIKYHDGYHRNTFQHIAGATQAYGYYERGFCLNLIQQGTDSNKRIAESVYNKSLLVHTKVGFKNFATEEWDEDVPHTNGRCYSGVYKLLIIWDRYPKSTAPGTDINDVLQTPTLDSFNNMTYRRRFKVLHSSYHDFELGNAKGTSNKNCYKEIFIPFPRATSVGALKTIYNAFTPTSGEDIQNGAIWIFCLLSGNPTESGYQFFFSVRSRVRYIG